MSGWSLSVKAAAHSTHTTRVYQCRLTQTSRLERHTGRIAHALGQQKPSQVCRHFHQLQITAQEGGFKRRSRRFGDNLLDNIENSQPDPRARKKPIVAQSNPPQAQSASEAAALPSQGAKRTKQNQLQNKPDNSRDRTVTDDWGWGYTGPTLATIGSNYEEELRASARNDAQPAEQRPTPADDNWGQEEEAQDWENDADLPDNDLAEEEAPDVTLLTNSDVEQLLKVVPQQQQVQYYGGTPVDLGVRAGTGLVLTLAASKIPLLAAASLSYPLWWPIYKAWSQNQKLRSQYSYVGLWRTKLLALSADQLPGMMRLSSTPSTLTFLIGNESSARTQISVPFNQRYEEIQVGESAELLLLSNTPDFSSFKALKEAYLPESGIWVAKYPFVDRDVFLDISLDIARSD